ncbi:glycosyltransferase family 2 protein [Phaeobacter gallaeciensis]|uniref:glycosyltransferase family 2 protein n=1 Tax=Phaeobacter gallaeciensis TaxID=60890 RepID=UPI000BBC596C|nr:glycosyltransferase family A protein [Phaeobacter gallaeciensis]ATF19429.1 Glycosyltransferase involved in cell wall biogenesis [Phaeobacter gallaeciensis]ATF23538.1 Glycosyltransferase involved in cell wall biogenesis [Phaeobacter gallaeciensis]
MTPLLSVLIPAHNEAGYIGACLSALFASDPLPKGAGAEVLVIANGCTDSTVAEARAVTVPQGWTCAVIDRPEGGKIGALAEGEARAAGSVLVYLDADVIVSPPLMAQICAALEAEQPRYASGAPQLSPARSRVSRLYGRFWAKLPFVREGVPGFGLFAMNRTGRARWGQWPDVIADDIFARLSFAPAERVRVQASYQWPLIEGFRNLVRVRRRQNAGVAEIAERCPALLVNEDVHRPGPTAILRLALRDPAGFMTYSAVALAVKSPLFRARNEARWTRGR